MHTLIPFYCLNIHAGVQYFKFNSRNFASLIPFAYLVDTLKKQYPKQLVAFLCCTLLGALPAFAKQVPQKEMMRIGDEVVSLESGKIFVKAQECIDHNQFDQAAELLKNFLSTYPKSPSAHYKYGFVLLQQDKNAEALEQAKLCTEAAPQLFSGWALLGEAAANLKQLPQAKEAYQKALSIQASGENADIVREHLSELNSPSKEAASVMVEDPELVRKNKEIMKTNKAISLCNESSEMLKQKQFEQALANCRQAYAIEPELDSVKEHLVVVLNDYASDCVQKENLKQAESLTKEAVSILSKGGVSTASSFTTLKNYAALLKFLGREDEAKQVEAQMKSLK